MSKAPAQQLASLENNEAFHQHACGEYVLERMQNGVRAEDLVDVVLAKFLVRTTKERLQAYRRYREQRGTYWTLERLEAEWRFLYRGLQSAGARMFRKTGGNNQAELKRLIGIRRERSRLEPEVPVACRNDLRECNVDESQMTRWLCNGRSLKTSL